MSRLLRGYALAGMEDQALWHERDISHSSVERVALPGATTLLHYMLERFRRLVEGLVVRPERMAENIERGLRPACLLAPAHGAHRRGHGARRRLRHRAAQRPARGRRADVLPGPRRGGSRGHGDALAAQRLDRCFDDRAWLTHVDEVIARLERLDP